MWQEKPGKSKQRRLNMKTVWIKMSALLVAAMLTATALTSCTDEKKNVEDETTAATTTAASATSTSNVAVRTGSEGLSFTVTGNGQCTLTGLGSCTDAAVSVPSTDGAGNTVTAIAAGAFKSTHVSAIEIPETVSEIADGAFDGCTKLSYISVSIRNADYCSVDGVLYDAKMTTLVCYPGARADQTLSIPSSVTVIAPYAFSDCSTLKTVEFAGSSEEWKNVDVGDDNAILANAKVSYAKEDGK
jgi:hypothetical protein